MTALQAYQFQSHQLRIISDDNGEPWFIAKDVCDILGYSNARRTVDDFCREAGVRNTYIPSLSNTYKLIDEGNLYRLIIKSNKPESEPFESWVCDEVLPAIRKTGSYTTSSALPSRDYEILQSKYIALLEQENSRLKAAEAPVFGLPRKWSAADDQNLLTLKAQGLGFTRIGYRLGRSRDSVKHRYTRLMAAQGGAQ